MLTVSGFTAGPFVENGYLVVCDRTGVGAIVDPGAGADLIVAKARAEEIPIETVLLTHAHLDHIEGLGQVKAAFDVPVLLHPDDRMLYDAAPAQAAAFGLPVPDLPTPELSLRHGQTLQVGEVTLEVRHTPGHAPGHVIFYAAEAELALVGDVIFAGSIGRTDLPGGDHRQLFQSIREQVLTLPGATRLYTGHGPETTVEWEARHNPFLTPQYGGGLA